MGPPRKYIVASGLYSVYSRVIPGDPVGSDELDQHRKRREIFDIHRN